MAENKKEIEKTPIMIEFGKWTSLKDIEDLKVLLEDIREKYHFRWFLHTYFNKSKELKNDNQAIESKQKDVLEIIDEEISLFYNHPDGNNICNGNDYGIGGLFIPEMRFKDFIKQLKKRIQNGN